MPMRAPARDGRAVLIGVNASQLFGPVASASAVERKR